MIPYSSKPNREGNGMTRAEAIELAAAAMWTPDVSPAAEIVTFQHAEADDRSLLLGLATVAFDALLEAGMTFGEEWQRLPGEWRDDGTCRVFDHASFEAWRTSFNEPVFVHRPQGESRDT